MTIKPSERWQEVKEILYPALEMEAAERASFLEQKCGDDAELRREIESLLAAHNNAAERFESPAVEWMAEVVSDERPEGMVGRSLGHYEIIGKLGAGGMGEVYLARDGHLDRKVALKLLPAFFTQEPDRLRRFQQEARAASALNHPNILTIYEIGRQDAVHYIATEFVDGETLRDRLNRGRLKSTEAIDIAAQIANALAAAHEAGIIHRDIKPENVMLRSDGIVKVVDFGIAKLSSRPTSESGASSVVNTDEGVVIGTAQYMSPEQARGMKVSARTDIFSLGSVLYEMVAGRAPFAGETATDILVAILEKEPLPLRNSTSAQIPPELDSISAKTLRKDPDERYQTSKDLFVDLQRLRQKLEIESHLEQSESAVPGNSVTTTVVAAHPTVGRTEQLRHFLTARRTIPYAAVLAVLILGGLTSIWSWRKSSLAPQGEINSLAVLPLKSLGNTGDNYIGLGIADAVIRRISQTGVLTVRPTSAVRRYMNEEVDSPEIARLLKVDALFEGTVQREGDRLRVSVNLLRTSNGELLWAESFDMRSADIFTIQDKVAEQVAERLRLHLDPTQQIRLAKRYTSNTVAYEYYVKAMYSLDQRGWSIRDKPQMETTIALFKQAISADPQYSLAYAQLAYAYAWMAIFIELDPVWVEHARQAMQQADALDPQLAETHVARHLILWSAYEGYQTEAAIHALHLAQQLNPSIGHLELGVIYWHNGLEDLADRELQRALEIDPTSEKVKEEIYNSTILSGRTDEGLAARQRFFNSDPDLRYYLEKKRLSDAQPLLEQALARDPNNPEVRLRKALFLALKEDFSAAEQEIPWILEHLPKNRGYHHSAFEIARVYALSGKSEEAVKWLRESAETGLACYPLFERDPYLDRVRQAPEFIQFMSEMRAQLENYEIEFG